jgi:ZIP family zinc transporter
VDGYTDVLMLALLPAAGNFVGGLLAELIAVSRRVLSLALHAAAGVVLAVVAIELMPRALEGAPPWTIVSAFVAGGLFFVAADQSIGILNRRFGRTQNHEGPWLIFLGVGIDLFSDGVMIGAGSTMSFSLALLLAVGQVPADLPEGFATMASFKRLQTARRTRLLLSVSFVLPLLFGATVGYLGVRGEPEIVKQTLLAFTAGVLTTVVVEEIVPEAHEDGEARFAALVFVGGFAVFTLLSAYFA